MVVLYRSTNTTIPRTMLGAVQLMNTSIAVSASESVANYFSLRKDHDVHAVAMFDLPANAPVGLCELKSICMHVF